MRVLLAFDKFKNALSARAACTIAAEALRAAHPTWKIDSCPLTDGGDGFAEILTRAANGELRSISVAGPRGAPVVAALGLVWTEKIPAAARPQLDLAPDDASVAIVEMAAASGLALLSPAQRDPWLTTSLGTGELIAAAAKMNASAILLGVGGSATNDLGLGALAALGLGFHSAAGEKIYPPAPARWNDIASIAGAVSPTLPPIRIACDVSNPLLGPRGCTTVFGPQKGLRAADRSRLEHASARLALMLCAHSGQPDILMDAPGAGAAGGIGFGLMAAARAKLLPGFDLIAAWLDLETRIAAADIVMTGEGRFDESSRAGKAPGAVASRALALGRRVHIFAGEIAAVIAPPFIAHAITPPGEPLEHALREAGANLAAAIRRAF